MQNDSGMVLYYNTFAVAIKRPRISCVPTRRVPICMQQQQQQQHYRCCCTKSGHIPCVSIYLYAACLFATTTLLLLPHQKSPPPCNAGRIQYSISLQQQHHHLRRRCCCTKSRHISHHVYILYIPVGCLSLRGRT